MMIVLGYLNFAGGIIYKEWKILGNRKKCLSSEAIGSKGRNISRTCWFVFERMAGNGNYIIYSIEHREIFIGH